MKKVLISMHEETAAALDKYKTDGRGDKSAFAEAVIARELGVVLPESAVDRRAAIGSLGTDANPLTAAAILPAAPVSEPVTDLPTSPAQPQGQQDGDIGEDKPPAPEPAQPAAGFDALSFKEPPTPPAGSTAFEETMANKRGAAEPAAAAAAAAPVDKPQGFKPPIISDTTPEPAASIENMPIVQPVQSGVQPPEQEQPKADGVRVCPTCGEDYDTPFCLTCL